MPTLFHGYIALVTGASSGIGRAIATRLAAGGSAAGVVGRNAEALEAIACAAAERILKLEGKTYWPEDLIQPEDMSAALVALLALPQTVEVTNGAIRPLKRPVQRAFGASEIA